MKILLFHPVLLPPKDYGGVERVLLWLAQGLVERGHEVFVAALGGSRLPAGCRLVEVTQKHYSAEDLQTLLLHSVGSSVDLIHFMAPIAQEVWDHLPVPAILTVHGNGKVGERFPKNTVFLSQDHARRHGAQVYVYNGLNPDEFHFEPDKKANYFLFLSKTSWSVKNLTGAMKSCAQAGVALKIAGGNRPFLKRFEAWIRPSFEWLGPVNGHRKAEALSRAQALLFPVKWSEPFGLVVAEALLSGTPVIASPNGSLPELIPSHVGILPKNDEEWIEILSHWTSYQKKFDPEACREWALEKFHYLKMVENYEGLYRKVLSGNFLHSDFPSTIFT